MLEDSRRSRPATPFVHAVVLVQIRVIRQLRRCHRSRQHVGSTVLVTVYRPVSLFLSSSTQQRHIRMQRRYPCMKARAAHRPSRCSGDRSVPPPAETVATLVGDQRFTSVTSNPSSVRSKLAKIVRRAKLPAVRASLSPLGFAHPRRVRRAGNPVRSACRRSPFHESAN